MGSLVVSPGPQARKLGRERWISGQRVYTYSVQSSHSVVSDSLQTHAAHQVFLSITNSQSLLKLTFIESVMPSNHLILCYLLLLPLSMFPSIRVFSNESVLHIRWPKNWSFSFSISPSNQYPGLISFRMDWLDLLAVQRTLKSLLQQHSSKASILQCSAFFIVQHSHPYMTMKKEFIAPGLHLRPVHTDHAQLPLQWTLNSLLSACGNNNGRIRPPLDRETLKFISRLLIA